MSDAASLPWEISVEQVQQLLKSGKITLIDCREPDEYAIAKIEGAKLVPMSELRERVGELEPLRDQHLVIHCHHGGRSLQVARALRSYGFAGVQSMAGGIDLWSQTIDPEVPRY
jgi:rhodanese-related sulfurtransferase